MAQVKLLKIASDGVPVEHGASDELTMSSFSVAGGGPSLTSDGLAMSDKDITGLSDLTFSDPTAGTLNQTAGALIIDNIMGKERSNELTTAADLLFPTVTDTGAQVDMLRLPTIAGVPTQSPTKTGKGFVVFDQTNNDLYIWDGATWDNQSIVKSSAAVEDTYTAGTALAATDVVYISAADTVSKAVASSVATAQVVGFAATSALSNATVTVRKAGKLQGFTSLTPGARYYLDGTTAGAVTASVPNTSGHTITAVGIAKNATTLDIQIQTLGRRA